jgi:hypothetical protein
MDSGRAGTRLSHDGELATQLIEGAADLAGAATAGAVAMVTGPETAIAGQLGGSVVSSVLKVVGARVRRRVLEPRQHLRAGLAFTIAADHIEKHLDAGAEPRVDIFISESECRATAEELLEGILRVAADEHQERKVRYLGRMFGEIVFRPDISADFAAFLIRLAEVLTWRQIVLAAYVGDQSGRVHELREIEATQLASSEDPSVLYAEVDDLANRRVIGARTDDGDTVSPASLWGSDSFRDVGIGRARLTTIGQALHQLMGLSEMPDADLLQVVAAIRVA